MKIFITGGAGFIGSHLAHRLIDEGNSVCVFDNLSSGREEHLSPFLKNPNFRFVRADILDFPVLAKSLKGFDLVFHLASNPDIAKGITDPSLDLKQGILSTFHVLDAMRVNRIEKLVFFSGSGVYGDAGTFYTPEDFGPLLPVSMYGASKLGAEALVSAFCHMFGMKAWVFRFANIVGARQTHGVIYDFIRKLNRNKRSLEILGNGLQSKSYLHVSDCLNAVFHCLERAKNCVNTFNVATSDYTTVNEIAHLVIKELRLKNVRLKYTGGSTGWKGDVPVVRLNVEKIRKLRWKAQLSSYEAVKRAVQENINLPCR